MEIILAIVVASAVIFFGALISIGNERQRKAIDSLREQVVLWAMQDLKIKRENLVREVRVDNPLEWLSAIASKACGLKLTLESSRLTEDEIALICATRDHNGAIVFSQYSPAEIRKLSRMKRSRLSQMNQQDSPLNFMQKAKGYQVSSLNSHITFDLELQTVWKMVTKQTYGDNDSLWIYTDQ